MSQRGTRFLASMIESFAKNSAAVAVSANDGDILGKDLSELCHLLLGAMLTQMLQHKLPVRVRADIRCTLEQLFHNLI